MLYLFSGIRLRVRNMSAVDDVSGAHLEEGEVVSDMHLMKFPGVNIALAFVSAAKIRSVNSSLPKENNNMNDVTKKIKKRQLNMVQKDDQHTVRARIFVLLQSGEDKRRGRHSHIKKALLDLDIGGFFESVNGVKFKNWCFSHVARSSSKTFLCKVKPHPSHLNYSDVQMAHTETPAAICRFHSFWPNHLIAKSYGCFSEVPPLPLKHFSLFLEGLPLLSKALFLLQHVAVAQKGSCLLITLRAQLLLQETEQVWFVHHFIKAT